MTQLKSLTVGAARRAGRAVLGATIDSAALDADLLLCETLSLERNMLDLLERSELDTAQRSRFEALLQRRLDGEPVAYMIRTRSFWTIEVEVSPATLVPRPETELVVERALYHASNLRQPQIADLGTGSGCIALALASELSHARIVATDLSHDALAIAKRNHTLLGLNNIEFLHGEWTSALPAEEFDIIAANPPYIADGDPCLKNKFMRFEPQMALIGGPDGLESIREIVAGAFEHLKPGGTLIIEHGYDQGETVRGLLQAINLTGCQTFRDLAGLERVTEGQKPLSSGLFPNSHANSATTGV